MSCLTIQDPIIGFIGRGRADTERTGLMRGEATLFMGVTGRITAGDFGLSWRQGVLRKRGSAMCRQGLGATTFLIPIKGRRTTLAMIRE
jgi:hypothetical protein